MKRYLLFAGDLYYPGGALKTKIRPTRASRLRARVAGLHARRRVGGLRTSLPDRAGIGCWADHRRC